MIRFNFLKISVLDSSFIDFRHKPTFFSPNQPTSLRRWKTKLIPEHCHIGVVDVESSVPLFILDVIGKRVCKALLVRITS